MNSDTLKWLIDELGLDYQENSSSYIFNCPICGKDKFYINKNKGYYICFRCAESDDIRGKRPEYALALLSNQPIGLIESKITPTIGSFDFFGDKQEEIEIKEGPKPIQWPLDIYTLDNPKSERGVEYLKSRGIPYEIAIQYGIRYFPEQQRVIFPLYLGNDLFGWQSRTVSNHPIKMLSSVGLPRNSMFMFENRLQDSEHIFLTEGPIDAIKAHLVGGNICSMGKIVTNNQLEVIKYSKHPKIYLALDPDADVEMEKLVKKLQPYKEIFYLEIDAKDLGEMDFPDVHKAFTLARKATNRTLFLNFK